MKRHPVKKRRKGKVLMTMGLLLMAAALFLACMNLYEERQGEEAAGGVLLQLSALIPEAQQEIAAEPELNIVDAEGNPLAWPLNADGTPMTWPTDEAGNPLTSVMDAQGKTYFWPSEASESGEARPVSPEGWDRAADGGLLPLVGDKSGLMMAWPAGADGGLISWNSLAAGWARLMEELAAQLVIPEKPVYVQHPDMEMPVKKIDGRYYIGVLEVPDKKLKLPIMSDWSEQDLKITPCRYAGSVYSGDIVIAGHNYYRHFSPIKWLENGTEVRFTDMDGNVFVYAVCGRETIAGDDIEGMLDGEWDLTLFTCTTGGRSRVAIRCRLTESVPAE